MPDTPSLAATDVLILCGGLGTRLRPILTDRPKPMAEIGGRPFLDLLIGYVSSLGFRRFILCVGHMGNLVESYFKDRYPSLEISLSEEKTPLGTAGALKHAEHLVRSELFFAMNGDSFCKVDMRDMLRFHRRNRAQLTLALTRVEDVRDYGSIGLAEDKSITRFHEKSEDGEAGWINAGIYCFDRNVLRKFLPGKKLSLEVDVFPSWLGQGIFGYETRERLFDIGTPERLELAQKELKLL
ncbi:MAG: galactokinase [Nitrospinae bacterium CG11_big_fil_rev_8_21_14_0_20_56_8]|nr:MAG: galactokinase [Nitrospinae bacterium CG11_big_fil_rev_8_21_14_0_20_56_8]